MHAYNLLHRRERASAKVERVVLNKLTVFAELALRLVKRVKCLISCRRGLLITLSNAGLNPAKSIRD